jgi:hypothetical protein
MTRQRVPVWLTVAASTILVGFVLWAGACAYDASQVMKWIGGTDLTVEFHVVDADSGAPVPNAEIRIHCESGFYDGAEKELYRSFVLRADELGIATRVCRDNWCIGTTSRLCFTDTRSIYTPRWHIHARANGYQPSSPFDMAEEYHGKKSVREAPTRDRLTVRIELKPAVEK